MAGKGKPRSFKTAEEFKNKAIEYLEQCEYKDKLANIAGFCVYTDITRDTYYQCRNYYPDTFKKVENMLEDCAVNTQRTTMGIFYLKNKFGYSDRVENTNTNTNKNISLDHLSMEDINKILEEE